jgi:hypothetical protein
MIKNNKTLSIPDCNIEISYEKSEGEEFGLIKINHYVHADFPIPTKTGIDFFVDKDSVKMIRDFFTKVTNEWV